MYMRWAGIKHITVSPEDPEANGLAENFMKMVKKVWHTPQIEKKNFRQEIFKYLRHYRSTPHSSTGRPPAELLFNRKVRTWLPSFQEPAHDPQVQLHHSLAKASQKAYKDAKSNVKPHDIQPGDLVLLLQKDSKKQSRYDPQPYTVTQVQGSQITAQRGNKIRLRDAQMFKKVMPHATTNYHDMRYPLNLHTHETSDFSWDKRSISGTTTLPHAPPAQPNRTDRAQHPGPSAPPRSGSPPRRPGTPTPTGPDAHRPARPGGPLPARPSAPPPDRPGSSLVSRVPCPSPSPARRLIISPVQCTPPIPARCASPIPARCVIISPVQGTSPSPGPVPLPQPGQVRHQPDPMRPSQSGQVPKHQHCQVPHPQLGMLPLLEPNQLAAHLVDLVPAHKTSRLPRHHPNWVPLPPCHGQLHLPLWYLPLSLRTSRPLTPPPHWALPQSLGHGNLSQPRITNTPITILTQTLMLHSNQETANAAPLVSMMHTQEYGAKP